MNPVYALGSTVVSCCFGKCSRGCTLTYIDWNLTVVEGVMLLKYCMRSMRLPNVATKIASRIRIERVSMEEKQHKCPKVNHYQVKNESRPS
mmetsp:Transcript_14962/g.31027  ORF Transcript_14962/g.31027 Transcript_14962/m.31027 type:complete len:91 (-) Transcript_14962:1146-1418(-)